jgi:hypothetical protein
MRTRLQRRKKTYFEEEDGRELGVWNHIRFKTLCYIFSCPVSFYAEGNCLCYHVGSLMEHRQNTKYIIFHRFCKLKFRNLE